MRPIILPHSVDLIIPNRDRYGKPVPTKCVEHVLAEQMSKYFGGMRQHEFSANWMDNSEKLVSENGVILRSSFSSVQLAELLAVVMDFAMSLAVTLDQAQVAVVIDGKFVCVDSPLPPGEILLPAENPSGGPSACPSSSQLGCHVGKTTYSNRNGQDSSTLVGEGVRP